MIRKIMNVFYYYNYLFYKNILKEDDPHTYTLIGMSGSTFFLLLELGMLLSDRFCFMIPKNYWLIPLILIPILLNLYFKNKGAKIVASKPQFFGSSALSFWSVLFCELTIIVFLFIGSHVGDILRAKYCR